MIYRGSFLFSWKTWETAKMLTNPQTCLLNSSVLKYSPRLCLPHSDKSCFQVYFPSAWGRPGACPVSWGWSWGLQSQLDIIIRIPNRPTLSPRGTSLCKPIWNWVKFTELPWESSDHKLEPAAETLRRDCRKELGLFLHQTEGQTVTGKAWFRTYVCTWEQSPSLWTAWSSHLLSWPSRAAVTQTSDFFLARISAESTPYR